MMGTGCRVQFYTIQVFVSNNYLYVIYWHIYNFRFCECIYAKFGLLLFPWRPFGLIGICDIGIFAFLHSGKLAGAINSTSISIYDQSWESMKCTLPLYS